jgi:methylmalonyl-CoA mutase cobalamin-binding subunit
MRARVSMSDVPPHDEDLLSITEVERQTGIRQATLRMWERRYGFPQPLRDRHGDRVYPLSQVERLHAVRRLVDRGIRPGQIFSGAVASTAEGAVRQPDAGVPAQFRHIFELLLGYRLADLHGHFQHRLLEMGLRRFIIEFLAPMSVEVGLAWSRGQLPVRCEHLFSQVASSILHAKQAAVRASVHQRPTVVLATLSGEAHALGILMAEAVMASFELDCIQLGTETPALEVAAAARDTGADIVALSFSAYFPRRSMVSLVTALRTALPPSTSLWIGGDGVLGAAALGSGVETFDSLKEIEPAVARWRAQSGT